MSEMKNFSNQFYGEQSLYYSYPNTEHKIVETANRVKYDNKQQDRKEQTAKVFKIIIFILICVILLQIIYHFYFAKNVMISKVEIEVDSNITIKEDAVLEMAGLKSQKSYFSIDVISIKKKLEMYPQIYSAEVEKKFPDTLKIALKGRQPLAICLVEMADKIVPLVVDSMGVVFQIGKSAKDLDLPIISGVKFEDARIGAVLPAAFTDFLQSLEKLRVESEIYFNCISECSIKRKSNNDFDILLYPRDYDIPVRLSGKIEKEEFTYILLVLDEVKTRGLESGFKELDFRTDKVVYKVRGG